jgi:hypothetical protein
MIEIALALALESALETGFTVGKCMAEPGPGWEEGSDCQKAVERYDRVWDSIQEIVGRKHED